MKVSKVALTTARRIFRLCTKSGQLNESHLRLAITKLTTEKPRDYRAILHVMVRLLKAELQKKSVTVESATQLSPAVAEQLATSLRGKYGQDLTFTFTTRPDLLGGMKVRVGNDVFDGSVKARLARLTEAL